MKRIDHLSRNALIGISSVIFVLYVLAPIFWLVSSSFQSEAEITSVPPHWIPHAPTLENFDAIFTAKDKTKTVNKAIQRREATYLRQP
jgi:multiple sugar transport system permease protein